jgi:NAD(P)-dependent dehydrogenase (short-subunit alcohol dehydrogenase family)
MTGGLPACSASGANSREKNDENGPVIAHGLADCGANVVCTSRKIESVQAVADAITAAGGEALAHTCNAGDLGQIRALVEFVTNECGRLQIEALMKFVKAECGRLDILINNAAANPYYGPATDLPPDAFDKTVAVNLKGPYYFMSHAVPLMIEQRRVDRGVAVDAGAGRLLDDQGGADQHHPGVRA